MEPDTQSLHATSGVEPSRPAILAPAGSKPSFMAALAAEAEAVYCGLKQFTARMEARNFTLGELRVLSELAHSRGTRVFVTLNTLLTPGELSPAGRILDQLNRFVHPDAVIVQDLAMAQLVYQTGYAGEVHWSTLANLSFPSVLRGVKKKLPVDSVVLPRELTVDEIKAVAAACPPGLNLEVFVHGALCYGISGRCYWSSFLGGKSSLRGRCVQPCRRVYVQDMARGRFFSCLDLSVDVLVKVLLGLPQIRGWKIEGRKKGPHYVYCVVTAYRLLRDHGAEPQAKKDALYLLSRALGRPGTHYYFLPQRPQNPVNIGEQTGSGLFLGRTKGTERQPFFAPQTDLLAGDLLRIGYEDAPGHRIERVGRSLPRGGRYALPSQATAIPKGTPVFLIDRREKALGDLIRRLEGELPVPSPVSVLASSFRAKMPVPMRTPVRPSELKVYRRSPRQSGNARIGIWLSPETLNEAPEKRCRQVWWSLPPVIFPSEEKTTRRLIQQACARGGRTFILNDPWQVFLFDAIESGIRLWAGPFCNLANPLALETAAALGFSGAVVSPELTADDALELPRVSPLPLGIVVAGNWPLCISRAAAADLHRDGPFRSSKGEEAWTTRYGSISWVFPSWKLDLQAQTESLRRAGYVLFIQMIEPVPETVRLKDRPCTWNWKGGLL